MTTLSWSPLTFINKFGIIIYPSSINDTTSHSTLQASKKNCLPGFSYEQIAFPYEFFNLFTKYVTASKSAHPPGERFFSIYN